MNYFQIEAPNEHSEINLNDTLLILIECSKMLTKAMVS